MKLVKNEKKLEKYNASKLKGIKVKKVKKWINIEKKLKNE